MLGRVLRLVERSDFSVFDGFVHRITQEELLAYMSLQNDTVPSSEVASFTDGRSMILGVEGRGPMSLRMKLHLCESYPVHVAKPGNDPASYWFGRL